MTERGEGVTVGGRAGSCLRRNDGDVRGGLRGGSGESLDCGA